jgi:hypothetical protein
MTILEIAFVLNAMARLSRLWLPFLTSSTPNFEWLKFFLAPMQDGVLLPSELEERRRIGSQVPDARGAAQSGARRRESQVLPLPQSLRGSGTPRSGRRRLQQAVEQVVVKRFALSEQDCIDNGTFQPKDEKNRDSTELTADINHRKIAENRQRSACCQRRGRIDAGTQAKIDIVKSRLIRSYSYNDESATVRVGKSAIPVRSISTARSTPPTVARRAENLREGLQRGARRKESCFQCLHWRFPRIDGYSRPKVGGPFTFGRMNGDGPVLWCPMRGRSGSTNARRFKRKQERN